METAVNMDSKLLQLDIQKFTSDVKQSVDRVDSKNKPKEVAKHIGVSHMTIYQVANGNFKSPSFNLVINLCRWMGKDYNDYIKEL